MGVSLSEGVAFTLLSLGGLVELLSIVGVLAMPHVYDRLHFLGPATTVGPILVAGAVLARESLSHQGIVAVLVALFLWVSGAVLTHATARAARVGELGDWRGEPRRRERGP
jgi:multicomponent Na+:H+ antiporter subunit G